MTPDVRHMTAEELLAYSNEPYRHELIAGRLVEMEPPGAEHGVVAQRIITRLSVHADAHGLGVVVGEAGFKLASMPDTVRGPDAAFVAADRIAEMGIPRGYWPGPPDLAVEVVSPNDRRTKVEGKVFDWLAAGTRAVVVLDPPLRTATVYRARDDIRVVAAEEELDLDDVVAGFRVRVDDLFVA